jgi:hypothetical protein
VVVIGAGAAGLVAAAEAARRAASVLLLEKNNKVGVKILMSGGTRCNLTHHTDARGITEAFGHARRFLQPSVGAFPPQAVVHMFHAAGVPTKVEVTGKIFPASDRALQVRDALWKLARDAGVTIRTGAPVTAIQRTPSGWQVIVPGEAIAADRLIITAGGQSYPGCGTTGDAYSWLAELGHTIVPPRPALVPLLGGFDWTHQLSGLAITDCVASVHPRERPDGKALAARRGACLLTHFGFSGPAAMDVSGAVTAAASPQQVCLALDLMPNWSRGEIERVLSDRSQDGGRQRVSAVLGQWLPSRLAVALVEQLGPDVTIAQLPRATQQTLSERLKRMICPLTGTRGFAKAEVTAGGVSLAELDPRTMASRIAPGLFIAGEVLDVDGPIGGFNFQAAFATGRAAGIAAATA